MAAVLNVADLTAGDNPADYCRLPVVIGSNHRSTPIVQFQCRISQRIGDPILRELRANGTNDHSLWPATLNNETANHHMLARLNKTARADVTKTRTRARIQIVHFDESNPSSVVHTVHNRGVVAWLQVCNDR